MTTNKVITIPFLNKVLQQQTDGGLIDISPIVDLVNEKRKMQGKVDVNVRDYFENGNSQEYLNELLQDFGLKANAGIPAITISEQNQQVTILQEQQKITIKELKELDLYKKTRGKYEGTWFTPLLAIDIVGWLDPAIKLHFNKLIMQELFRHRIAVSDGIRSLTNSIVSTFGEQDKDFYSDLNIVINKRVYGRHETDIRNQSSEEEYKELARIMKKVVMLIEEDVFSSVQEILSRIPNLK
jgi:hypothetical protein